MKRNIFKKVLQRHFKNNYDYYIANGFKIIYDENIFKITYNKSNYCLDVIKEKHNYYLRLTPYSKSYFQTSINLKELKFKLDMALFALKENEKIHKKNEQIIR